LNPFKKLLGDTAIYGTSSILGRILNWCLAPYYSFIFAPEIFAVFTNLYAFVAFFLVLLTYGMETSFFRYASKSDNPNKVYSTSLISLFFTSLSFILLVVVFKNEIAALINYPDHPEYILWFGIILCIDAFISIPFARLRLNNRPIRFAALKFINIGITIFLNVFFLSICPAILKNNPDSFITVFYSESIGVGYVFIANLLASLITLILLVPEIFKVSFRFEKSILKQMLSYGFPILLVGLAGAINQSVDKILIPFLVPEEQNPMFQLGVYGANFKLAVLMNMFIQAFRYAFEPFFFSQAASKNDPKVYATIMKYFVIFGLVIFLGMVLFLDLIKFVIQVDYHDGLRIVPMVLMANLFFGIYFALSLWYKLTDMTRFGAYIAAIGSIITISLNFILIPEYGYVGSAIAIFTCFLVMMVISYFLGQKYYPIPYNIKRISSYFLIAVILYVLSIFTTAFTPFLKYTSHTFFLLIFITSVFILEKNELSGLFKLNKKK
jgi:O-antigen/teichoic acid export membrane protein